MITVTKEMFEEWEKEKEEKTKQSKSIIDKMIEDKEIELQNIYFRDIKKGDNFLCCWEIYTACNNPYRMDDDRPYQVGEVLKVYVDGGSVGRVFRKENEIVQKVIYT